MALRNIVVVLSNKVMLARGLVDAVALVCRIIRHRMWDDLVTPLASKKSRVRS
ncbi:MAG: hypothetical protein ACOYLC_08650 [Armatimonadaceae bacterium]